LQKPNRCWPNESTLSKSIQTSLSEVPLWVKPNVAAQNNQYIIGYYLTRWPFKSITENDSLWGVLRKIFMK
jgi:hypothetical protein